MSVAEYVPVRVTDASVRGCVMYANLQLRGEDARAIGTRLTVEISEAYDAWLEAHDRTERAAAWDEGYDTGCNDEAFEARGIPSDPGSKEHPHANPYRERGDRG